MESHDAVRSCVGAFKNRALVSAAAALDENEERQLVTVRDDVDLPVITAFRLLAAKLAARHPILLKDVLKAGERIPEGEAGADLSQ